uniref:EpsG family protein n=1 Tax=Acetatifactor sp. TaxID=1872090 RepID=UPI00405605A8
MIVHIKRSKVQSQKILEYIICLLLIVIMGLNTYNVDMKNYVNLFHLIQAGVWPNGIEKGFLLLLYLANKLNLQYYDVVCICAIVGTLLVVKGIRKYTDNIWPVLLCYFIFPFFLDVIQIRNFMAMAIFIYGTQFLLEKNKIGLIKYIITILISASFHNLSYIYLIFCVLYLDYRIVKKYIIPAMWIVGFVALINSDAIFNTLSYFAPNILRYTGNGLGGTQFSTKIAYVLYLALVSYIFKLVKSDYWHQGIEETREQQLIYKIAEVANWFIFFMVFDVDFYRVYRNLLVLFYVVWCDYIFEGKKVRNNGFPFLLIFLVISFYFFIGIHTFDTVIIDVITNNKIFLWLAG